MSTPLASLATADDLPAVLSLPAHRRVFRLGPDGRFLGLDPATAVVVENLPPGLTGMLDELDGTVPRDVVVDRAVARGARRADALALLADLHRTGAVVDAAAARSRLRHRTESTVLVDGRGPLAVGVAVGLAIAGVGTVYLRTSGSVGPGDLGSGLTDADLGRPRAEVSAAAVRAAAPTVVTGPPPRRLTADLVVLTDVLLPEPVVIDRLHARGRAHLAVRLREGVGLVGPLVLPGRTACLRCLELHRLAREPAWPSVAAQLVGRPGRGDRAVAVATAALATAQAIAALDGTAGGERTPPTLEATLELDPAAGTMLRRPWTAHIACRCGAADRWPRAAAGSDGAGTHGQRACTPRSGRGTIMVPRPPPDHDRRAAEATSACKELT